jgi:hypothetical protein
MGMTWTGQDYPHDHSEDERHEHEDDDGFYTHL